MTSRMYFNILVYHKGCPDGTCGLWCAYRYQKKFRKIGMNAGIDPTDEITNKKIVFVDVCPSYDYIKDSLNKGNSLTILDHHKSSYDMYLSHKEELDGLPNLTIVFDNDRSGCQIAWDYFFRNKKRPWFIDYVGDRDLWTWSMKNSKEISKAIFYNRLLDAWNLDKIDLLLNFNNKDISNLAYQGKNILEVENKIIERQLLYSVEGIMNVKNKQYRVQIANIMMEFSSDLGNALATKIFDDGTKPDFGVVWTYDPEDDLWHLCLRAVDSDVDLSELATQLGGGGHKNAAGIDFEDNPFKLNILTIIYEY